MSTPLVENNATAGTVSGPSVHHVRKASITDQLLQFDLRNAFDPHSAFINGWQKLLLGCLLYEIFLLPFTVAFNPTSTRERLWTTTEFQALYAVEVIFLGNFYVELHTGYYEDGHIHRDTRKSRLKYVTSVGFVLDVVAILPLSLLPISLPPTTSRAWLEAHKLLRMRQLPRYFASLSEVYANHFVVLKILKGLVVTAFITHVVACGRFAFGSGNNQNVDPWLPPATKTATASTATNYLIAFFWGFGLLTGVFDGELPRTNSEFLFTIAVMLAGFVLFIKLCANVFVISKSENSQRSVAQARINQLKHLLSFHHVPESLQAQAVEYIKRHYTDAESNDREVMKLLCPSIAKDIQVELLKGKVARIPLFHGCSDQFIMAITSLLEMITFPAHVTLFSAGDPGDCMYLVNSGVLHILVNGTKVRELTQGSFFGEVSVFSKWPRTATVVTTTYCTLYKLSRFHTERVLEGYPHYAKIIAIAIDEIVNLRHSNGAQGTNTTTEDDFMLTTLYQRSTEHSPTQFKRKRGSVASAVMKKKFDRSNLRRSKSSQNCSTKRNVCYDGGALSINEDKELNASSLVLPPIANIKKHKLVRSKSAFVRHMSGIKPFWSMFSKTPASQDAIQGFYDNLSRRALEQQQQQSSQRPLWTRFLMRTCIDATSNTRKWWLVISQCHLLFNWTVIPLMLAFPLLNAYHHWVIAVHAIADVMLLIDIYLNLHLSYTVSGNEKISQTSRTAIHYLRHGFVPDLLCTIPLEPFISSESLHRTGLLRIPKLLRIWRLKGHLSEWNMSFRLPSKVNILVVFGLYLLVLHLVSCLYFSLTHFEGYGEDLEAWLPANDLELIPVQEKLTNSSSTTDIQYVDVHNTTYTAGQAWSVARTQYMRSLYFAATMLTTLGKTVEPRSNLQYGIAVGLILGNIVCFTSLVDKAQKRLTASALEQKEFLITRTRIRKFLGSQNAPIEIQQRVNAFLEFWWSSHRGAIAEELLNELPMTIKRQVVRSMCQPIMHTLSLLTGVQPVLDELENVFVDNVKFILYGQGEIIYRQGDYASGLFFLLEGDVVIIPSNGAPRTIPKGGFFGTASLHLSEQYVSYAECMTAISGCVLVFISREQLNTMHQTFSTLSMALKSLEKRLGDNNITKTEPAGGLNHVSSGVLCAHKLTLEMRILRLFDMEDMVFDPDSSWTSMWQTWIFLLIIIQSMSVIFNICFGIPRAATVKSDLLLIMLELFFSLDLFFHSRLGYYEYGNKIMDLRLIRKRYYQTKLLHIDVAAVLPLFVANWILPFSQREDFLNLNKLLRLARAPRILENVENRYVNRTLEFRLVKLLFYSLLLSHLFGCIWFNFAQSSSSFGSTPWMPPKSLAIAPRRLQYLASLFWSFGLMSSSYSGERPEKASECCFTFVTIVCGFFLFIFVANNLTDVVELIDADTRGSNGKLSSIRRLFAHFELPFSVEDRLKAYFFFQRFHNITQEHILERCLPPSLVTDIRLIHLQPMITKVAFLGDMEGPVTRMLVAQFCQVLTVKNEYVFRYGEEGTDMFFVFTGILEIFVPVESLQRRLSNLHNIGAKPSSFQGFVSSFNTTKLHTSSEMRKVTELTSGGYFGEVAMFTSQPRSAEVRSKTSSVLYKLSRRSLDLVFERYPDWKCKVLKIVNIQQEQQHLRNLYMEEQLEASLGTVTTKKYIPKDMLSAQPRRNNSVVNLRRATVSDQLLSGLKILLVNRNLSAPSSTSTSPDKHSTDASAKSTTNLRSRRKSPALWIDTLLECTEAQSDFHLLWLKMVAIGTIYMGILIPYRVSFDPLDDIGVLAIVDRTIELICELLFTIDIWINWNMKEGLTSMELYEQHYQHAYKKDRLWIDIVASFPIDYFLSDFYVSQWLRINRCLKLLNFPHYIQEVNRRSVSYEKNRLWTLGILYFVLMHWCTCAYFSIASMTELDSNQNTPNWDTWIPPHQRELIHYTNVSSNVSMLGFFCGFFFSSAAFTKRGKKFAPDGEEALLFTIIVNLMGLLMMAFVIGEVTKLYMSYVSNEVEFRKNHIAVNLYLDRWHISANLSSRAKSFLSSLWSSHRGVNYRAIFEDLPPSIRTDSVLHLAHQSLQAFTSIFRPFATVHPHDREINSLMHVIAQNLKYEGYPHDENVIVEGSINMTMYFVVRGVLASRTIVSNTPTVSSLSNQSRHYTKGDFFGEQGLLGYSVSGFTVKTKSACDLLSLSSESLLNAILSRPLFHTALNIVVEAYRKMCRRGHSGAVTAETLDEWGDILYEIVATRKDEWLGDMLNTLNDDDDNINGDPSSDSSKTGGYQSEGQAGLLKLSNSLECIRAFESLFQLIVVEGIVQGQSTSFQSDASQFHDSLPIMSASMSNSSVVRNLNRSREPTHNAT